jgi:RsiW-degrading membrane proteinase PrsW (M82 family)
MIKILSAITAAVSIAAVYLIFLREIDIFEKEKKRFTLICFLLGVFATFILIPIQIFFPVMNWFPSEGSFLTRLTFHVLAVASFEEWIKIFPFLIMLRFTQVVDESFDYIKYASVGAMGFATVENILYFSKSLHIIEGRAFYTAILHMFTSSVIAYALFSSGRKSKVNFLKVLFTSYLLAVLIHGSYNALISSASTYIIGVVLVGTMLIIWGRMMNNLLNNSAFFHEIDIQNKVVLAGTKLLIGWAFVFFFAFFSIVVTESLQMGIVFLKEGLLFGVVSGIGLYYALAKPRLKKGLWFPLLKRWRSGQ